MPSSSSQSHSCRTLRFGSAGLGLSLAVLAAGCGGEDKGRVSGREPIVEAVDQCKLAEAYDYQNFVDFEPIGNDKHAYCDPEIASLCDTSAPVPFYFNYDPCPNELFDSNISQRNVYGEPLKDGARCGVSESALHVRATHVSECYKENGRHGWGAGLDLIMRPTGLDATALDGGPYEGISFWVRKGATPTKPSIIFSVVDTANTGSDREFSSDELEDKLPCGCVKQPTESDLNHVRCYSDPPSTVPDGRKCDAFGAAVTLTDEWTFVAVPFTSLRQKGFGAAGAEQVDPTQIRRLQFLMVAGDWDYWIDDLKFFKAKP
ncbi:MAG TPA: hypothetical protein VG937_07455 [Polyangiaceae bacterium]|nr:hypothetical protein [Polyangiaceae bacterium]